MHPKLFVNLTKNKNFNICSCKLPGAFYYCYGTNENMYYITSVYARYWKLWGNVVLQMRIFMSVHGRYFRLYCNNVLQINSLPHDPDVNSLPHNPDF